MKVMLGIGFISYGFFVLMIFIVSVVLKFFYKNVIKQTLKKYHENILDYM